MSTRYTLTMFEDSMGSFKQPGCTDKADALWHVNSARDHDGLPHLNLEEFEALMRGTDKGWARFTLVDAPRDIRENQPRA